MAVARACLGGKTSSQSWTPSDRAPDCSPGSHAPMPCHSSEHARDHESSWSATRSSRPPKRRRRLDPAREVRVACTCVCGGGYGHAQSIHTRACWKSHVLESAEAQAAAAHALALVTQLRPDRSSVSAERYGPAAVLTSHLGPQVGPKSGSQSTSCSLSRERPQNRRRWASCALHAGSV